MKVHIEGNIYIESDSSQFIVKEYTGKLNGKGKDHFIPHGYFSTIAQAVKKIINLKIKASTAKNLQELVQDVKRIEDFIASKINF